MIEQQTENEMSTREEVFLGLRCTVNRQKSIVLSLLVTVGKQKIAAAAAASAISSRMFSQYRAGAPSSANARARARPARPERRAVPSTALHRCRDQEVVAEVSMQTQLPVKASSVKQPTSSYVEREATHKTAKV